MSTALTTTTTKSSRLDQWKEEEGEMTFSNEAIAKIQHRPSQQQRLEGEILEMMNRYKLLRTKLASHEKVRKEKEKIELQVEKTKRELDSLTKQIESQTKGKERLQQNVAKLSSENAVLKEYEERHRMLTRRTANIQFYYWLVLALALSFFSVFVAIFLVKEVL